MKTYRKQKATGIIKRRGRTEYVWHNQIHKTCTEKAKLSVYVRIYIYKYIYRL